MKKTIFHFWDTQIAIGLLFILAGLFLFRNGIVHEPPLAKLIGQVSGLILSCVGLLTIAQRSILRNDS